MYELKIGMTESGKPYAAGIGVGVSPHPATVGQIAEEEKADLFERRLQRIEAALGFDATDVSLQSLASALNQL